jgi:hypothetical protein
MYVSVQLSVFSPPEICVCVCVFVLSRSKLSDFSPQGRMQLFMHQPASLTTCCKILHKAPNTAPYITTLTFARRIIYFLNLPTE